MPPGGLARQLEADGVDISAVTGQIEAELAWAGAIRTELRGRLRVTDEEVDAHLARIEANKDKPQYLVKEIFIPVDNPKDENEARATTGDLMQQLASGASFSSLARNFSRGATASKGGSLGWIRQGELGNEFDRALADLSPGRAAGPLRMLDGYRILLLLKTRVGNRAGPEEATLKLSQIFLPLPGNAPVRDVQAAMEASRQMGGRAKNCADMERLGKEAGSAMSGSLGTIKLKDLPKDIRAAVANLPVNRASAPQRNAEGVIVLMVCERHAPSAPKPPDKEQVKRKLMSERLAVHAQRYLRDLRRSAIIDVRL